MQTDKNYIRKLLTDRRDAANLELASSTEVKTAKRLNTEIKQIMSSLVQLGRVDMSDSVYAEYEEHVCRSCGYYLYSGINGHSCNAKEIIKVINDPYTEYCDYWVNKVSKVQY